MGDKLEVKIITKSGMTHMLTITKSEYEALIFLLKSYISYVEIEKKTGCIIFTKDSIESIELYMQ